MNINGMSWDRFSPPVHQRQINALKSCERPNLVDGIRSIQLPHVETCQRPVQLDSVQTEDLLKGNSNRNDGFYPVHGC
jgi:hypothetical protein